MVPPHPNPTQPIDPNAPNPSSAALARSGPLRTACALLGVQAKAPFVLVEDLRGGYKPLFHEFTPRSGRGTHPMLMAGHADDTPGGKLFLSEVHSISAHFGWGSDLLELLTR